MTPAPRPTRPGLFSWGHDRRCRCHISAALLASATTCRCFPHCSGLPPSAPEHTSPIACPGRPPPPVALTDSMGAMAPAPVPAYHYRFVSGQTPGTCPAAMPTRRPRGRSPPPVTPCRRGTASAIPGQRSRPSRKDRTGPHGACPRLPLQTRTGRPPVAPAAVRPLAGRVVPRPVPSSLPCPNTYRRSSSRPSTGFRSEPSTP